MPYIPREHKKYKLLPFCRKNKREVFEYPSDLLDEVNKLLPEGESLMPYGYKSYDEYYDEWYKFFQNAADEKDKKKLDSFANRMLSLNVKETWAVLKYVGETSEDCEFAGLTHGKYYYCPRPTPESDMIGVVDNEEFTSYMYPCDSSDWIVYEDPTGEASKALNQKPKVDRMCPCCQKHYFLPDSNELYTLCPVCGWEPDRNNEGLNKISLDEARKRFNPNKIDLTNIFKEAFESLSEEHSEFICNELAIDKKTLLGLTERQFDCIYSVMDVYEQLEYSCEGRFSERYKSAVAVQTSIEEFFRKKLGNLWWDNDFSRQDVVMAHRFCHNHKDELAPNQKCGCFYCLSIFDSSEIKEWLIHPNPADRLGTALCPECDIDSVIGESSGYPITPEFLQAMNNKWFS